MIDSVIILIPFKFISTHEPESKILWPSAQALTVSSSEVIVLKSRCFLSAGSGLGSGRYEGEGLPCKPLTLGPKKRKRWIDTVKDCLRKKGLVVR